MKRSISLLAAFLLTAGMFACSGGGNDGGVSDADYQEACQNGVTQCAGDPTYGTMFGAQDCSMSAIEAAYAHCDAGCRANSKAIIDCQKVATDCDSFVDCVGMP